MKPSEALEKYLQVYYTSGLFDRNKVSEAADAFDKAVREYALESLGIKTSVWRGSYSDHVTIALLTNQLNPSSQVVETTLCEDSISIPRN